MEGHSLWYVSRDRPAVRLTDVLVAALLFLLAMLADVINRSALPELEPGLHPLDVAMLGLLNGSVALRRRFPLVVLCVSTIAFLLLAVLEIPEGTISSIALFLALFSAGAYSRHRRRDLVRGASVAVSMGSLFWFFVTDDPELPGGVVLFQVFSVLLNTAFFTVGWIMGDLWRKRSDDTEELARRAETMERQRHQLAEQAVAAERLRIARELHDVVAHHVSLMGVQAGAARRLLGRDPARLEGILSAIEATGREAVGEMGRLVGFLRDPSEDEAVPAPQPTLERLDNLVDQMRDAGLDVALHRIGKKRELDPTVDLSAFRVVQEALTNALKHGTRPEAIVEIGYLVDHLSIRVRNPAHAGPVNGGGRGLVGMRERASVSGGWLHTATRGGWFEIQAAFPYPEAS